MALGNLTKKQAKDAEGSIYGNNYILSYDTEDDYKKALEKLKAENIKFIKFMAKFENETNQNWAKIGRKLGESGAKV